MKHFIKYSIYGGDKYKLSKWQIICTGLGVYIFLLFIHQICIKLYTLCGFDIKTPLLSYRNGNWLPMLYVVIIGPILEEIQYRLGLSFK